jgi:serine/threonine-protein kinase RsbW
MTRGSAHPVTRVGESAHPSADLRIGDDEGRPRVRTVRLPFQPTAVPIARAEVVAHLTDVGVEGRVVEEAEMVVAELVGNAVRHASPLPDGAVRAHWQIRDGVVEIEVTDGGGETRPTPQRPPWYAVSGRGLRIVRSLAHEWGVIRAEAGHTVWASVGGPSRRRAN